MVGNSHFVLISIYSGSMSFIIILSYLYYFWIVNRKIHECMTSVSHICSSNGGQYQHISFGVVRKPILTYCKCIKLHYIDIAVAASDVLNEFDDEQSGLSNDIGYLPSNMTINDSSKDLEADDLSSAAAVSGEMSKVD